MAAGTFFGGLLAASATVTAISITGTLQFRATHPSATDTHGLDGARITLAVTPDRPSTTTTAASWPT